MTRPALWTQTRKAQAQITQQERARRIERQKWKSVPAVSRSRASLIREYQRERKKFLVIYSRCAVNPNLMATEIHHRFGRSGELLLWKDGWLPVARESHNWIHANIEAARQRGWIAKVGEWWKQP